LSKSREQSARAVLELVHGAAAAERELLNIGESRQAGAPVRLARVADRRMRKVMIFGFGIAFFQQATGINAVFYYPRHFFAVRRRALHAFGQSVFVGL